MSRKNHYCWVQKSGTYCKITRVYVITKHLRAEFVKYKGKVYCWCRISSAAKLCFNQTMLDTFNLGIGDKLLAIRSGNIAFTMGARGQLLERAENFEGNIKVF